jgi:hypothetical protein
VGKNILRHPRLSHALLEDLRQIFVRPFGDRPPGSPRCTKTFDLGFPDIGPWAS